jgi:iron-sulfur cluster assembly accessory protein
MAEEPISQLERVAADAPIAFTDKAAERAKHFAASISGVQGKPLRIGVLGLACCGPQYKFYFDEAQPGDTCYVVKGVPVVIDHQSVLYLQGKTIDYVERAIDGGFTVKDRDERAEIYDVSCECASEGY